MNYLYGQKELYSGMLPRTVVQSGAGFGRFIKSVGSAAKDVNSFAKNNKLVSKLGRATDMLGVTGALNAASGGLYSQSVDAGKQLGYGRHRRHKKRKGVRRPKRK